VRSLKELCEGNRNSHSHNSETIWEGEGNREYSYKKALPVTAGQNKIWESLASRKVFARILDEFCKCFDLQKTSVLVDKQFKISRPLPLYCEIDNHLILSQKSVLDGDSQH